MTHSLPDPTDPSARAAAVDAARRPIHPDVLASLRVGTDAQAASRDKLAGGGVCVVTGQQAGLFGGPLYTLHKTAATIANARALEAETGVPCAPVFWLQCEDHDFEEIASVALLDRAGDLRVARVEGVPGEADRSVWARRLGDSVRGALDLLGECVDGLPHDDEVVALFEAAYTPQASPSEAFVQVMERLFAPHGLLVVDPAHPSLVEAARPIHERAIAQAGPLAEALQAQADALQAAGRPAPVYVRPGAPLSFVHPEGRDGPRYRVEPDGEGWRLVGPGTPITQAALEAGPHSTSALLRPILQDAWLPTAAYVGGPGEIAYLPQVLPLWSAFDLPVPLIVPRARFLLKDVPTQRLLDQLDLSFDDLDAPRDELLARLGEARGDLPDPDALLSELTASAFAALDAFEPQAAALEHGLETSVGKTRETIEYAAERLVERYQQALARDDEIMVDRLDRLLDRLVPGGDPQERVHGWPPYAARVGLGTLAERLIDAVVPFDGTLRRVDL